MRLLKSFQKISWRLTLTYLIVFLLVIVIVNIFVLYSVKYSSLFTIKREFKYILNEISHEMLWEIHKNQPFDIRNQDLVEDFNAFLIDYSIKITDPKGDLVGISDKIKQIELPAGTKEGRFFEFKFHDQNYLYFKKIVQYHGKVLACLEIIRDISLLDKIQEVTGIVIFLSMGFGAAISILSGLFLTRQLLKPIGEFTAVANKITIGNLHERLVVRDVNDELTDLAKTFNRMLSRLEAAVKSQNQFVSDASHELRTPLAVIRGYINLLDRWGSKDEKILREAINAIKDETVSMSQLTKKLLQIAKGVEKQPLEMQQLDWALLIKEVVKESRLIDTSHDIEIVTNPEVVITGDKGLVKQMIRIFLDNSIKYTPERGSIRLQTKDLGTKIELIIEDTGIGIPGDELDKVFDRFYRVDKARSRDKGGHGLGLYIAKQIVNLHHGKIKIESQLNKGTTVRVNLPKQQPAVNQ